MGDDFLSLNFPASAIPRFTGFHNFDNHIYSFFGAYKDNQNAPDPINPAIYWENNLDEPSRLRFLYKSTLSGATLPTEFATLLDNGNWGIATSTPKSKLEIFGGLYVADQVSTLTAPLGTIYSSGPIMLGSETFITTVPNNVFIATQPGSRTALGLADPYGFLHVHSPTTGSFAGLDDFKLTDQATGDGQFDGFSLNINGSNVDFVNYENGNMRFSTNGSTVRMTIDNSGNALIGASTPIQLLTVGGNAYKSSGGSAWDIPSDERLKTDIKPFLGGLNEVIQINPIWFKYNGLAGTNSDNQEIGVLAQNIKQSSPYMIKNLYDSTFGEYLGLNNGAMIYLLINSVKELKAKNDFLEQKLIKFGLLNDSTNLTDDKNIKENSIINQFKGRLGQNVPNPFLNTTTIEYEVSIDFKSAFLRIFDQNGNIIHIENIFNKGINLFQFNYDNSESKILYYSLIIDTQIIETKKMLKL